MNKGITTPLIADIAITQPLNQPTKNIEASSPDELSTTLEPLPGPKESEPLPGPKESPSSVDTTPDIALTLEQKIQQEQDQVRATKQMLVKKMDNKGWLDDHLCNSLNRK